MHRPLGRAALVVYAPFSLAVARLHCPARLALAHLPPESAAGQAGLPALQCNPRWLAPTGQLPKGLACSGFIRLRFATAYSAPCAASPFGSSALRLRSNWRARGSSAFGVFACLRSPIWLRLRADASSSRMQRLFSHPARNPQG